MRRTMAPLRLLALLAVAACSGTSRVVPEDIARSPQYLEVVPGDGTGTNSTPPPEPGGSSAEKSCNTAGGTFYYDTRTGEFACAGRSGGPAATTSWNARCNYTIQMTRGHGTLSRGGALLGSFQLGIEVADDCSYTMFS